MKYNFDKIENRKNTSCLKWDMMEDIFGCDDLIPMWVADMDFPSPQPIVKAIKKRADHPFFGYTQAPQTLIDTVVKRVKDKFKWNIKPEWIVFTPGVMSGLNIALNSLTHPGDRVILQEPCYHQFFPVVKNSGCQIVTNPLKLVDKKYEIDFENLKEIFSYKQGHKPYYKPIKTIIFCNPNNPTGRVWRKEEIEKLGNIAIENNLTVIADEIHSEILLNGNKHTTFGSVTKEFEENCIVCISPSKTFNLSGIHISPIIIPNEKIRREFIATMNSMVPSPDIFAYTALEAGFKYGDDWLKQVLEYLEENLNLLKDYFKDIKGMTPIIPEGTYLVWIDCKGLEMDNETLNEFLKKEAKVCLEDGSLFGTNGKGFMRMNIAMPRPLLEEALKRIKNAVYTLNL
ncbi:MalY/PatB family protein [Methanobrevibacter arboriphilus]|uniref:MalY/PatB family protein n=1 Tax=Methanobrevibacter arboriphilus TaxID=39441 RepID=UPI0005B2AEEE|nr:MalY/PatB family protein [Methanobrevibacter arboriphilus]